jgi:Fe-S oxidoreductase
MMMQDEWCCGNTIYSVGMIEEAKELAKRNIEAVKASGAKVLLTSCAECYRMWKVDYPKMLNIATTDLGFKVVHLIEFADEAIKNGSLKPKKPVDVRFTYHDACSVSRLCDPWTPWNGERGWMGMVSPPLKRRRGQQGLYFQTRNILNAIPGTKFVEMPRIRENALCCGAGRGTKEAFPELASFSAKQRIEEVKYVSAEVLVSACPWCKTNFNQAIKENGDSIKAMDISEFILSSLEL